jgi:hypothetical protein
MPDSARAEIPELIIRFENERPITAKDLGALFAALARDYARLNKGRTLVVAKLQSSTLTAVLQDLYSQIIPYAPYAKEALEVIKAAKPLKEFAELVRGIISKAKNHPDETEPFKKSLPGVASAEGLLRVAALYGGELEIETKNTHKHTGESELKIRYTSHEAIRIREAIRLAQQKGKKSARKGKKLTTSFNNLPPVPSVPYRSGGLVSYDATHLANRLSTLAGQKSDSDAEAVIRELISVLKDSGLSHILESVAKKLEERGLRDLAAALR